MHIGIMSRNIRRDMGPRYAYSFKKENVNNGISFK